MPFDAGTTDVPTAGVRVQISNTKDKVLSIMVAAPTGNGGGVAFGRADVSMTNGLTLLPGDSFTADFGQYGRSVLFEVFYVDAATNGNDVEWAVILA